MRPNLKSETNKGTKFAIKPYIYIHTHTHKHTHLMINSLNYLLELLN